MNHNGTWYELLCGLITGFCLLIWWLYFLKAGTKSHLYCLPHCTLYGVDRKPWVKFAALLSMKSLLSILVNYHHLTAFQICFLQKVPLVPNALKIMIFLVWGYANNSIKAYLGI